MGYPQVPGQHLLPDTGDAWQRATALREALILGEPLPRLPIAPVRLQEEEIPHAEIVLNYSRFYALNVSYPHPPGPSWGAPAFIAAGAAADAVGAPFATSNAVPSVAAQWREHQQVRGVVTDRRVLCFIGGTYWRSFWHRAMMRLDIDLHRWAVVQTFTAAEPVRWHGLGTPWLAVALTYLGFGVEHLIHRPELAMLGPVQPPRHLGGGYEIEDGA